MYNFLYELGSCQIPADFWVIVKGAFILLFPIGFVIVFAKAVCYWRRMLNDIEKERTDD